MSFDNKSAKLSVKMSKSGSANKNELSIIHEMEMPYRKILIVY